MSAYKFFQPVERNTINPSVTITENVDIYLFISDGTVVLFREIKIAANVSDAMFQSRKYHEDLYAREAVSVFASSKFISGLIVLRVGFKMKT